MLQFPRLKCLDDLLLDVCVVHFRRHHVQELWQVDGATLVRIHRVGQVLVGLVLSGNQVTLFFYVE